MKINVSNCRQLGIKKKYSYIADKTILGQFQVYVYRLCSGIGILYVVLGLPARTAWEITVTADVVCLGNLLMLIDVD